MRFIYGGGALSHKAYKYHDALEIASGESLYSLGSYFYFREQDQTYCSRYVLSGTERPGKQVMGNKPKIKLMLDSGAFSAWKRGLSIDIDEYIAYIKHNEHLLHTYVNLDVIPGSPGKPITQAEVDAAAKASHRNLVHMRKAGLRPIPVFHYGESFDWLHRLLDEGEDYIGLGGTGNASRPEQVDFFDRAFTVMTDRAGNPLVKTHGFGVASFPMLKRYPWYTCDATSWVMTAAMGSLYVPVTRAGQYDYTQAPVKLTVSEVDRAKGMPPDHYLRFGDMMKRRVKGFLDQVGVTIEQAAVDYEARARAIVYFMLKFQDAIGEQPFRYRVQGFK